MTWLIRGGGGERVSRRWLDRQGSPRCAPRAWEQARPLEWEAFLRTAPTAHHLQSTAWADVKSFVGWRTVRAVVSKEGHICAGAQILLRRSPPLGSIGYVSHGPVLGAGGAALADLAVDVVVAAARAHRVHFLVIQPPPGGGEPLVPALERRGFLRAPAVVKPHPTTTAVVDCARSEGELLAEMKSKTRYNIRLAQRKGVVVREGGREDVPRFHHLLAMTGRRQGFDVPSREYFDHMLRVMSGGAEATILLAEFEGRLLSAALLVAFGDLVSYKRGAWLGERGDLHPNELLHWSAMLWAKRRGYRYYDFEGVEDDGAEAEAGGRRTVSTFKMGFGGAIVHAPDAYVLIDNPILRWGYQNVLPRLVESAGARQVIASLRNR